MAPGDQPVQGGNGGVGVDPAVHGDGEGFVGGCSSTTLSSFNLLPSWAWWNW